MATANPFDILGDDDNDDPSQLIAKQEKKIQSKKAASPAPAPTPAASATSKFPSKPSPPTQAVRETRTNYSGSGGFARGGSGRGGGRGGAGRPREFRSDDNGFTNRAPTGAREEGRDANISSDMSHQPYRGPRRGGYQEGDSGRPRRTYERHSGTGRGNEMQRQGSGRGNWGSFTDEPVPQEHEELMKVEQKVTLTEKPTEEALDTESKDKKIEFANEAGEKEAEEDKEMTLEEYEKIKEENRKALLALKTEERKVEIDKDLQSMQLLSTKKGTDEIFIKLGSGKDAQKKKDAERDERAKKSVRITEFLKPAEGERYYGGGRGRGNRGRGQFRGGYSGGGSRGQAAPAIADQLEFPTLGGK